MQKTVSKGFRFVLFPLLAGTAMAPVGFGLAFWTYQRALGGGSVEERS